MWVYVSYVKTWRSIWCDYDYIANNFSSFIWSPLSVNDRQIVNNKICSTLPEPDCCRGKCESYRGKLNTTNNGLTCKSWIDQPRTNWMHPLKYDWANRTHPIFYISNILFFGITLWAMKNSYRFQVSFGGNTFLYC